MSYGSTRKPAELPRPSRLSTLHPFTLELCACWILRLDCPTSPAHALFLVAPDAREADIREQLRRPAFSRVTDLKVRFLPYSELSTHRESIARFGHGMKGLDAIAPTLI